MKLAYIISAYKYPQQLTRLVNRLYDEGDIFLIHIDKDSPREVYDQAFRELAHLRYVHFLDRHRCAWGNFGHVQTTLKGIEWLHQTNAAYDYAILLTGQDYPLRTNKQIKAHLAKSSPHSFMEFFPLPYSGWSEEGMGRVRNAYFWLFGKTYRLPRKPRPLSGATLLIWRLLIRWLSGVSDTPDIPFYGGSSYWCLHRSCIDYIFDYWQHNPSIISFFRHVHISDELFFQTILLNSPLKDSVVNDSLRYVDWTNPTEKPAIICCQDLSKLASSKKLFGRKFDASVDEEVMNRLDAA